jgi:hypothetical protein
MDAGKVGDIDVIRPAQHGRMNLLGADGDIVRFEEPADPDMCPARKRPKLTGQLPLDCLP